ncbi:MAG: NUDIX domain-containing protein [Magnetococcales bacterium]|nr:NUDIX domain-containing protein [Magnetococcales bacterium]NGZ07414.1 NUDIX domain-containing protein [Magnetococcales bacterium]
MKVILSGLDELYRGFFRLLRLRVSYERFDGRMSRTLDWEILERGDAAAVLLYDPQRDVVGLIRQFRPGPHIRGESGWTTEIVAGSCGNERDPLQVALRETLEETGWQPYAMTPVCCFYLSPSGSSERIHLYCGLFDSTSPGLVVAGLEQEGEDIQPLLVPFATARQWLEEQTLNSAIAILAMQWLLLNRNRLRQDYGAVIA